MKPTSEERVLEFLIKFQELGYIPVTKEVIAGLVGVIEKAKHDELETAKT